MTEKSCKDVFPTNPSRAIKKIFKLKNNIVEKPISKKKYLNPREVLENTTGDLELKRMSEEVNRNLGLNEDYPLLYTNASDCN